MTTSGLTCPFCSLGCDDLAVVAGDVDAKGCAIAAAGFARRPEAEGHRIAGRPATLDEAVAAAAGLLAGATQPVIGGLATDLDGLRALIALADATRAVIDHALSAATLGNLAVVQAGGWMTTTFAEIANRADVILVIGRDPARRQPRFWERLARNPRPLYRTGPPLVAHIGTADEAPAEATLAARVEGASLLDGLSAVRLALAGRPVEATTLPVDELAGIAAHLAGAAYGVVVWDAGALDPIDADLVVESAIEIVRAANARTRCAGLPIAGGQNAQGAVQTLLWQIGWPARVSFADGAPVHDPWAANPARLLAQGEADVLLWVAAIGDAPPLPGARTIALIGDGMDGANAEIVIRVGRPAIDHAGTIIRGDGVIALPLAAARPSSAPTVAGVAQAINAALPDRGWMPT